MTFYDTAKDTPEHRRIVVMGGTLDAYICVGVPIAGTDEPNLGPRYDWTIANSLDRHDLMVLSEMLREAAFVLPWVDVDADGVHHVRADGLHPGVGS